MHYTKPSYYDNFRCTAGDCPDTCCQGWQIIIEPEAIERYKANPELWDYVKDSIDYQSAEDGPCYKLEGNHCTHLTEDGLCEMQVKYGFDALCQICKLFPRHTEEYDGERELSIDLSCPVGAEMILNDTEGRFESWDDDTEETDDYEDFDYFLYTELQEARENLFKLIDHKGDIDTLLSVILTMAKNWQECLDDNRVCEMNEERYLSLMECFNYENEKRLFSKLFDMELLRHEWIDTVQTTFDKVFANEASYKEAVTRLEDYNPYIRRVLRYMIYVYFNGAVYDDMIFAKAAFAVFCTRWSFFVFFALDDSGDEMTDLINAVYIFSREVEHSDININMLEDWFEETLL